MRMQRALPAIATLLFLGCQTAPVAPVPVTTTPTSTERQIVRDPHSFSNPDEAVVRNLALALNVDFNRKVLDGTATLSIENLTGTNQLILDARDLVIKRVMLDNGRPTTFQLGDSKEFLGQPLTIAIESTTKKVTIDYATSPTAAALQWLAPSQTAGGKHPYLFTQSQAILARTWVPIQDTPGVRFPYAATVRVPKGLMALMSAENPQRRNADGVYSFVMPQPIPSYLLALAVGDIDFRALDERSGVYSEPAVVEKAAWELADTPKMIDAAEELFGPYRWGRYDLLILPPSFPFGGMENPRLTFATPTILAGDRSLTSLVAHELAHSWSGNLVTNATWNDFWLNEGFTTYIENRIMEHLYQREYSDMISLLGIQGLQGTIKELGPTNPDSHLKLNLAGRDPDEGLSDIAYEKGRMFLTTLERTLGRAAFDTFIRSYFETYSFESMTTEGFVTFLRRHSSDPRVQAMVQEWIYGPGLPSSMPQITSTRFANVDRAMQQFLGGVQPERLDTKGWSTHEWLHFLRALPKDSSRERIVALDRAFKLTQSGNAEILHQWFLSAIRAKYEPAYPALERYLTTIGRRKLVRPLFAELAKTPEGKEMAMRIYRTARPLYHAVTRGSIDTDLGWK